MKKIMVLVCAVAAMLSANAAFSPRQLAIQTPIKAGEFYPVEHQSQHAVSAQVNDTVKLAILSYGFTDYTSSKGFVNYVVHTEQRKRFYFAIVVDKGPDVKSGEVYTLMDMESDYTWCADTLGKKALTFDSVTFVKTVTETSIALDINAWVGDTIFVLDYLFNKPIVAKRDTVIATDLELDARDIEDYKDMYGFGVYFASSIKGLVSLTFVGANEVEGTYDENIVSGKIKGTEIFSGSVTVEADENENYTIVGDLLTVDSIEYHIDLSYAVPKKTRTATLTMENGTITDYIESNGAWQALWIDQTAMVMLTFRASDIAGEYSTDDIYSRSSNIVVAIKSKGDTATYLVHQADIVVEEGEEEDAYTVTGTLLTVNVANDSDVTEFTLNLSCGQTHYIKYDEQQYTWNNNFNYGSVKDTLGNTYVNGYYFQSASVYVVAHLEFGGTGLTEGTYELVEGGEKGAFTAGYLNGNYLQGSYVVVSDNSHIWFLVSGTITVNKDGSVTIDAVNSYGKTVKGTIYMAQTPVENVNAMESKPSKILRNGQIILQVNGRQFNVSGQEL